MDKMYSVVISRFNEPIEDIIEIINYFSKLNPKIYLYNKSSTDISKDFESFQNLIIENIPNFGRESHTYLYHMYKNYETLEDICYFIPGTFLFKKENHFYNSPINILNSIEEKSIIKSSYADIQYNFIIDQWLGFNTINREYVKIQNYNKSSIRPYGKWFETRINKNYLESYENGWYGCFQTTRENIRKNSKDKILEWIEELVENGPNGEIPHYWERSWASVFGTPCEYKCEIVTPAGRKRYLEILYEHLKIQKEDFDTWQLWCNTTNIEDIEYMKLLEKENSWIKVIESKVTIDGNNSIPHFFEYTKNEDTVYIRLDDDIVYLSPKFIKKLKTLRLENPEPLFIYPNIINNAIISHIHYRNEIINYPFFPGYACMDTIGWKDPVFCEKIHETFLNSLNNNKLDIWTKSFNKWTLNHYERVSINCICWFGSVMKNNIKQIIPDEEDYISCQLPKMFNKYNVIFSEPICSHYAFFTQREYIDTRTKILDKYKKLVTN